MKMNDHDLLLLRHLQAAATFNNIGATQLKRGDFEDAIDNFKEALHIMNKLSDPNSKQDLHYCSKMEAKLHRSVNELTKTSRSAEPADGSASIDFSFHFSNLSVIQNLLECPCSAAVPMCIDTCELCCNDTEEGAFISAAILYNMGISNLIKARQAENEEMSIASLRMSRKLLTCSLMVLENLNSSLEEGDVQLLQSVSASLLVLENLVNISIELEDLAAAIFFDEKLEDAKIAADQLFEFTSAIGFLDRQTAGAA
jgi:tetratricopeptide (TPR) repeat protein